MLSHQIINFCNYYSMFSLPKVDVLSTKLKKLQEQLEELQTQHNQVVSRLMLCLYLQAIFYVSFRYAEHINCV